MEIIQIILHNFFAFVVVISLIVFIHEFGHFIVARLCGVKVEEFSLGFGPELFSYNDKKSTRWKICLLPFGGYVKMFGDRNGASMPDIELSKKMTTLEKKQSFLGKNVWQRMAIVAAGPIANFLLAIVIFTFLLKINGLNKVAPIIDDILPTSAAIEAGLQKGDKILAIDAKEISDFDEIRAIVTSSANKELLFKIERGNEIFVKKITPKNQLRKDFFGDEIKMGTLGVTASQVTNETLNLGQSFIEANVQTYKTSVAIFAALGELITGRRSIEELGGPIKIAKYSGKTFEMGIQTVAWFMAMISINLGVMNLLPLPVLDGGHLFFYAIEAIRKKPLPQKVQQLCFQFGFSVILALMIFTTINDLQQLFIAK
jgi:regulator of sigma E protease